MVTNLAPWSIHRGLTEDRLGILAKTIVAVRHQALDAHQPSEGDTNWGLGCRVYERTCHAITQLADQYEWLQILEPPLHFVFTVDGVPIRFWHGEPLEPKVSLLRRNPAERNAQQLAFEGFNSDLAQYRWRLVVITDRDIGRVTEVVMVQASGERDILNQWSIPLVAAIVMHPAAHQAPAVEQPAPSVRLNEGNQARRISGTNNAG